MDTVDATCSHCDEEMRWLTGTPRICGKCRARLKRLELPRSVSHPKHDTTTSTERVVALPAARIVSAKK